MSLPILPLGTDIIIKAKVKDAGVYVDWDISPVDVYVATDEHLTSRTVARAKATPNGETLDIVVTAEAQQLLSIFNPTDCRLLLSASVFGKAVAYKIPVFTLDPDANDVTEGVPEVPVEVELSIGSAGMAAEILRLLEECRAILAVVESNEAERITGEIERQQNELERGRRFQGMELASAAATAAASAAAASAHEADELARTAAGAAETAAASAEATATSMAHMAGDAIARVSVAVSNAETATTVAGSAAQSAARAAEKADTAAHSADNATLNASRAANAADTAADTANDAAQSANDAADRANAAAEAVELYETRLEDVEGKVTELETQVERDKTELIDLVNSEHPQTEEEGFFVVDTEGNIYAKLTKDGLDIEKATPHMVEVLKAAGLGSEMPNVAHVAEEGMHITDAEGNVHARYTEDGFDVNKVAPHFIALLKDAGIAPANIVQVAEEGFFVVDAGLNVHQKTDAEGTHAPNLVEFRIVES